MILNSIPLPAGDSPANVALVVRTGALPDSLASTDFEALWAMHPPEFNTILMVGKPVQLPRWQRAFGKDYRFSGKVSTGWPMPPEFAPFLAAAQVVDPRINGLLVNWYDGDLGHYIGKHRDSPVGLVEGAPILTFSLGEARTFRIRRYRGAGQLDLNTAEHPVIAFGWVINRLYSHEVLKGEGKRISVTARAFA
jgi:alkylated DNA repair dioxygenase AlkB